MNILTIFTCYNRRNKTQNCIETITACNPKCAFTFVVADDGSNDGTYEMLCEMQSEYKIYVVRGSGNWFYSGGMNAGMEYSLRNLSREFNYTLMINDDVEFLCNGVQNMIEQSVVQDNAVIVGAMRDNVGNLSYGAVKYISGYKYRKLNLSEWKVPADTFNANCVLIPYSAFERVGTMDPFYRHSLGDFDYGLILKRDGNKIFQSKQFVGVCNNNSNKNSWTDSKLGIIERIRKKESIKGAPAKQWFYFLKKNFGVGLAIRGVITPYVRILLGK